MTKTMKLKLLDAVDTIWAELQQIDIDMVPDAIRKHAKSVFDGANKRRRWRGKFVNKFVACINIVTHNPFGNTDKFLPALCYLTIFEQKRIKNVGHFTAEILRTDLFHSPTHIAMCKYLFDTEVIIKDMRDGHTASQTTDDITKEV